MSADMCPYFRPGQSVESSQCVLSMNSHRRTNWIMTTFWLLIGFFYSLPPIISTGRKWAGAWHTATRIDKDLSINLDCCGHRDKRADLVLSLGQDDEYSETSLHASIEEVSCVSLVIYCWYVHLCMIYIVRTRMCKCLTIR